MAEVHHVNDWQAEITTCYRSADDQQRAGQRVSPLWSDVTCARCWVERAEALEARIAALEKLVKGADGG